MYLVDGTLVSHIYHMLLFSFGNCMRTLFLILCTCTLMASNIKFLHDHLIISLLSSSFPPLCIPLTFIRSINNTGKGSQLQSLLLRQQDPRTHPQSAIFINWKVNLFLSGLQLLLFWIYKWSICPFKFKLVY